MRNEDILNILSRTFEGFSEADLKDSGAGFIKGKVRDILDLGDEFIIITSDRISAFDRVLTTIPCKGEVLNRMALYWFDRTKDIIPNHISEKISGRTVKVRKGDVLPVEVVIRAYLTGSSWRDYQKSGTVSGIKLPEGMKFNQAFSEPLLTPSTKAERGAHDEPISSEEIIRTKLVEPDLWREIEEKAFALFKRGTEIAGSRGLILVDTKYEFGILDGKLILLDEVHTPDSSRFWFSDTYAELFEAGEKQKKIDKEYLRQWLMEERGFMGDGDIPVIPDEIRVEVARRYIQAYELITGEEFVPEDISPGEEKKRVLQALSS